MGRRRLQGFVFFVLVWALQGRFARGTPALQSAAVRPNPDAEGKYHVGDGVTPPKLILQVMPEFSEEARKKKIRGTCTVSLVVDVNGKPGTVTVVASSAENQPQTRRAAALSMDAKAVDAVSQYRFEPAQFQGRRVPVEITVAVEFQIF